MANDFMMIIHSLEKDKGIDKDVLLEAIKSAIVAVTRKALELNEEDVVIVDIDEVTGKIDISFADEKIDTETLGRIAAQTARQVIMQKMKEAETDVVYNLYKDKVGEIVSGVIQRFDNKMIILEVGRTEAILPREHQVFRDDYKLHDRLRVHVLDLKRSKSHMKLFVSRSSEDLVRKLFEFEVPEIVEGTVEIKGVVREAGERTKIAVYSEYSNVDCVGACVGMRGSRVKSIVNELRGEKIDIIRWDENPKVFIENALSPAEILHMKLDEENHSCKVIVAKDKLSLAIGKKGQNVRLVAKLTKWDIDIQSDEPSSGNYTIDKLFKDSDDVENSKKHAIENIVNELSLDNSLVEILVNSGFTTVNQIGQASTDDLTNVLQIDEEHAQEIINLAKEHKGD